MNGQLVTTFQNADLGRGAESPSLVGLQTHTGHVAYRKIRLTAL